MPYTSTFLLIAGLYLVAAASPGPNFFIVSQLTLDGNRRRARRVAVGIAVGSTLWAASAIVGLAALLSHFSYLATALRMAGAAYLVWYGLKLLQSAQGPASPENSTAHPNSDGANGFRTGLFTNLTNPKAAAFWTSVFASTLPAQAPAWFYAAVCAMIAVLSASWHLGITVVFATRSVQLGYARVRKAVNAVCGGALVLLGLQRGFAGTA